MFKRNQVEQAVGAILEPELREPSLSLKIRIKRLLNTDRAMSINLRSHDPEKCNYAFFRQTAPGSGVDVGYSGYDAFALLLGLQLMSHNWPQRFVTSVMRRIRIPLEREHTRILGLSPKALFDQKAIRDNAKPGSHGFPTTAPSFLVIVPSNEITREGAALINCEVCPDLRSAMSWITQMNRGRGGGGSMFELTIAAHGLAEALATTQPHSRGRAS